MSQCILKTNTNTFLWKWCWFCNIYEWWHIDPSKMAEVSTCLKLSNVAATYTYLHHGTYCAFKSSLEVPIYKLGSHNCYVRCVWITFSAKKIQDFLQSDKNNAKIFCSCNNNKKKKLIHSNKLTYNTDAALFLICCMQQKRTMTRPGFWHKVHNLCIRYSTCIFSQGKKYLMLSIIGLLSRGSLLY